MVNDILSRTRTSLIVVGHSGAGKSTLAKLLSQFSGARVIEVGHQVIRQAAVHSNMSALEYADEKLRHGKYFYFVEPLAQEIELTNPVIVVGPRQTQEITFLQQILGSSIVIGLEAPKEIRERRRCKRIHPDEENRSWLSHRDEVERSWGAVNVLRNSNIILNGTKPPQLLLSQAARAWSDLGKPSVQRAVSYYFPLALSPSIYKMLDRASG